MVGFTVCGMHYMGQGGISNYTPVYNWSYVLGAAIIAITASTVALGLFFYLKSHWTNSWQKRGACAVILATAVSGMHWTATVGTQYRLNSSNLSQANGLSRQATVIVVICLVGRVNAFVRLTDSFQAIGACAILITFAFLGQRDRQRAANRAQQVVLACATFDMDGRLLVTPEGVLPSQKITNSYIEHVSGIPTSTIGNANASYR